MDLFDSYATDPVKELEGAKVPIGTNKDTEYLVLARLGNRRYARAMAKAIEENSAALEDKSSEEAIKAADDLSDKLLCKVLSETILLGWGPGFTYKKSPIAYSKETAQTVLAHSDFRRKVMEKAAELEQYKATYEEQVGNA